MYLEDQLPGLESECLCMQCQGPLIVESSSPQHIAEQYSALQGELPGVGQRARRRNNGIESCRYGNHRDLDETRGTDCRVMGSLTEEEVRWTKQH